MANRFPLIVDSSTSTVKELVSADNLNLDGCGIINALNIGVGTAIPAHSLHVVGTANVSGILTANALNSTSSHLAGHRNKIINGSIDIWQRGDTTGSLTTTTTGAFGPDHFFIQTNTLGAGSTVTASRSTTAPAGFDYSLRLEKTGTAVFGDVFVIQPIELITAGLPGEFYVGSQWTVSCWADWDLTNNTDFAVIARFSAVAIGGTSSNVFINSSMTSDGETSNGFTKYFATFTVTETSPAGAQCMRLIFRSTSSSATYTRRITGIQLEPGPSYTQFERRNIGEELALCQRFFQIRELNRTPATSAGLSGVNVESEVLLHTPMRITPNSLTIGINTHISGISSFQMRVDGTGAGSTQQSLFAISNHIVTYFATQDGSDGSPASSYTNSTILQTGFILASAEII